MFQNINVSYFPSKESNSTKQMSIAEVLSDIRNGKYRYIIENIRSKIVDGQID